MQYGLWDVDVEDMSTVGTAHQDVKTSVMCIGVVILDAALGGKLLSEAGGHFGKQRQPLG